MEQNQAKLETFWETAKNHPRFVETTINANKYIVERKVETDGTFGGPITRRRDFRMNEVLMAKLYGGGKITSDMTVSDIENYLSE